MKMIRVTTIKITMRKCLRRRRYILIIHWTGTSFCKIVNGGVRLTKKKMIQRDGGDKNITKIKKVYIKRI
jgi:hypothetical protein